MVRAPLTSGERAAVRDSEDMDQNTKSSHLSRVKNPAHVGGHRGPQKTPTRVLRQLHEAVYEESVETRITDLEAEVRTLKTRIEHLENTNINE